MEHVGWDDDPLVKRVKMTIGNVIISNGFMGKSYNVEIIMGKTIKSGKKKKNYISMAAFSIVILVHQRLPHVGT